MRRRAAGMGRIFKRKSRLTGEELATWWIAYYVRGKERREASHSTDRGVAMSLLKQRLGTIAAGKPIRLDTERTRVEELLADLVKHYEVNGKPSLPTLLGHVKVLSDAFAGDRGVNVTTARLEAAIEAWQRGGVSNATINRRLGAFKRAFSLGYKREPRKVASIPTFPRLEERSRPGRYLTREAFDAIHANLPDYLRDFFEFAYLTGVRRGQLARTTWRHLNTERWVLSWEPEEVKNKDGHVIALEGRPREIIERRHAGRVDRGNLACPYIFDCDRQPIGDFKRAWATACKRAGFPIGRKRGGYVFHNTRHTAVTNLVQAGGPEKTAMSISGHKTRSVFDTYTIRREDVQREAMEKVSAYVAGLPTKTKVISLSRKVS